MSNYYVTEAQVKDALQINSFREVSKAKLMEFVSLIPNMDKDVAISIINQFPAYTASAKVMVEQMNLLCSNILQDNSDSRVTSVSAYQQILNSLALQLDKGNLSAEQQKEITDQMILIADRIAAKDTENKQFLTELFKYGSCILGGALLLGAAILGVNVKGTRIPSLKRA